MIIKTVDYNKDGYKLKGEELKAVEDLKKISKIGLKEIRNNVIFLPDIEDSKDTREHLFQIGTRKDEQEEVSVLKTNKYVGLLCYKGRKCDEKSVDATEIRLEIGSSFDKKGELHFLQYMLSKVFRGGDGIWNVGNQWDSIFDFIPNLVFPYYLKRALAKGVYKEYRTFKRNDAHFRGVLDVPRHIRLNHPFTGSIAYTAREYSYDNSITELIRHTIEYIRASKYSDIVLKNCDEDTKNSIRDIEQATAEYNIQARRTVVNENLKAKIHPYYHEYNDLRKVCLLILRGDKMSYGWDDSESVYGFVIDITWLWENYLYSVLREDGYIHKDNRNKNDGINLFACKSPIKNYYPDFYSEKDRIVLDAKYKDYDEELRTDEQEKNPSLQKVITEMSMDDFHQLVFYMHCLSSEGKRFNGGLIFPSKVDKEYMAYPLSGLGGKLALVWMKIPQCESYIDFKDLMKEQEQDLVKNTNIAFEKNHQYEF